MDEFDFLREDDKTTKDAKYNIFRYQDHLKEMIELCAIYSIEKKYQDWFEAVTCLYRRAKPFFDEDEQKEVKKLFNNALASNIKLSTYNSSYNSNTAAGKRNVYNPGSTLPMDLHIFEEKVLEYMQKHNLLMLTVKKGTAGAGSR